MLRRDKFSISHIIRMLRSYHSRFRWNEHDHQIDLDTIFNAYKIIGNKEQKINILQSCYFWDTNIIEDISTNSLLEAKNLRDFMRELSFLATQNQLKIDKKSQTKITAHLQELIDNEIELNELEENSYLWLQIYGMLAISMISHITRPVAYVLYKHIDNYLTTRKKKFWWEKYINDAHKCSYNGSLALHYFISSLISDDSTKSSESLVLYRKYMKNFNRHLKASFDVNKGYASPYSSIFIMNYQLQTVAVLGILQKNIGFDYSIFDTEEIKGYIRYIALSITTDNTHQKNKLDSGTNFNLKIIMAYALYFSLSEEYTDEEYDLYITCKDIINRYIDTHDGIYLNKIFNHEKIRSGMLLNEGGSTFRLPY